MRVLLRFGAVLTLFAICVVPASTQVADRSLSRPRERRVALVVGNDAYPNAALRNARNDASSMAKALGEVGFAVTLLQDASRDALANAVASFGNDLQPTDVALFYFAGHGVQANGENFLIPAGFQGRSEADVRLSGIKASEVQQLLQRARVALLILDACRNNPYSGTRGGGGLAPMDTRGSLVAFSTGSGQTAADRPEESNGLFTRELLKVIKEPGLSAQEVFQRVRQGVYDGSGGVQFPAVYDGLLGTFRFREAVEAANVSNGSVPPAIPREDLAVQEELLYWSSIKDRSDAALFDEYVRRYGDRGRFTTLARARLTELRPAPIAPAPATTAPATTVPATTAPRTPAPPIVAGRGPRFEVDKSWGSGRTPDVGARWPVVGIAIAPSGDIEVARRRPDGRTVYFFLGPQGQALGWYPPDSATPTTWPTASHAIAIDRAGNRWLGSASRQDGLLVLGGSQRIAKQFGMTPPNAGSNDLASFGPIADIYLDEAAGEAYLADGYANRRVVVIDMGTGAIKRYWGAYGNKPDDRPTGPPDRNGPPRQQFGTPVRCVEVSNDGLVYVCDTANDRIQVFTKDGRFIKEIFVARGTSEHGTVFDVAFSADKQQRYLYVADPDNDRVRIFNRDSLEQIGEFGGLGSAPGKFNHPIIALAVDARGNIYTGEGGDAGRVQRFLPK